jgi:peptidoglycan/xylan/chitin deacetylase (PgdA/CDA1 family)
LAHRGFILGSHTHSHPFLVELDDKTAYEEIRCSKDLLQDKLGIQVDFFSYPYSATDARIEGLVESSGYSAACAGGMGPFGVFHLWRVPCGRDDTRLSLALKASGWYDRRTALRESALGRLLRRGVRRLRRRPVVSHTRQLDGLNPDLRVDLEKKP